MKITNMDGWGVDGRHREPYFECKYMNRIPCCCCNACPLDPKYPNREVMPEDPNQKCKLSRKAREGIAARYPGVLRYNGLTPGENAGKNRWNALSPAERARRAAELLERGKKHRGGAPGAPGTGPADGVGAIK